MHDSAAAMEAIVERIVRLIGDRNLRPGDQLPSIRSLAETLGEKVTLVRDALLQAQARGYVKVVPRGGAFVQSVVPTDGNLLRPEPAVASLRSALGMKDYNLFHLLDARRVIEAELAAHAAEVRRMEDLDPVRRTLESMAAVPQIERKANYVDLDIQFHVQLARLGQNPVLADVLAALLEQLRPYLERLPWSPGRRRETDASHAFLYQALVGGRKAAVRKELQRHLQIAYDALLTQLRTPPVLPQGIENV
jgi:DNA-binding FadR family transcriptional regulator